MTASEAIVPLLGKHYHGRGQFGWEDLRIAFGQCQWVEEDQEKDREFGLVHNGREKRDTKDAALWYRRGVSPVPEFKMRDADMMPRDVGDNEDKAGASS